MGVLTAIASAARPAQPVYVYPVPAASGTPGIDGRLTEPQWEEAPPVTGFTLYGPADAPPAPVQTALRALYDEQHLYVGVLCHGPAMERLAPASLPRDTLAGFHITCVQRLSAGDTTLVCVMNITGKPVEYVISLPAEAGAGEEFYTGVEVAAGAEIMCALEPGDATVYVLRQ